MITPAHELPDRPRARRWETEWSPSSSAVLVPDVSGSFGQDFSSLAVGREAKGEVSSLTSATSCRAAARHRVARLDTGSSRPKIEHLQRRDWQ